MIKISMLKVVALRCTRNLSVLLIFPFSYLNLYGPYVCRLDANIFTCFTGFEIVIQHCTLFVRRVIEGLILKIFAELRLRYLFVSMRVKQ